ncbi:MAG: hypothetical protein Fur0021_17490 [Candidatus Promineifilaceae bacterium]
MDNPELTPVTELRATPGWWGKALLLLLWLAVALTGFFWAHKPFTGEMLLALSRAAAAVATVLGLVGLGGALGWRLAGRLLATEPLLVRLALSSGLGLGGLALLVLGLGGMQLFQPLFAWLLALLLAAALWRQWTSIWRAVCQLRMPAVANAWQRFLRGFSAVSLLLTLGIALAPDIGWDAHIYHLTGPRLYLTWGGIGQRIDLPEMGFPQLTEMLYTLGLLLANDQTPPLLHFAFGLMGLAMTAALANRYFDQQVAWITTALLLSGASFVELMSRSYVEMSLFFYLTVTLYALLRWREGYLHDQEDRGWLWLAGATIGLAGGVKYTAAITPLAAALAVVWVARKTGWRAQATRLLILGGIAGALLLPWLLKNWLLTGNPTYPFLFDNALYWDAWRGEFFDRPGSGLWPSQPARLLLAPLEATILGTAGSSIYDATIGPFILTLPLLLPLVWGGVRQTERGVAAALLLFFGVHYLWWLAGLARSALAFQTRLLMPIFAPMAVLGGLALARVAFLSRPQLKLDWLTRVLCNFGLGLLLFAGIVHFLQVNPLPVVVGLESRDSYYARHLGAYAAAMAAVNDLPATAQVQFLWEPRSYLCQIDCQPDAILDAFLHLAQGKGLDSAGIAAQWERQGVTHVLFYQAGYEFILADQFDPVGAREQAILADLQANYLRPISIIGNGDYVLYQLVDS